jgi:hypothetical protein
MFSHAFRFALFCLALLGMEMISHGGITSDTPYTDRGKTDFDTVLKLLNPYGTWSKIDGKWAYTPLDHLAPYTDGRWIYTEYGWYWKGHLPHSWATEHYGYWKHGADKVWSWYPGPYWLPEIVEIRSTSTYIGWRSGEVDDDGNFVEEPIDRYSKPDEWTFVTLAQFANPIKPGIVAPLDVAKDQLDDSIDCHHVYLTYRAIDRPGPHPADVANLCKDGGMLAPKTLLDESAEQPPAPAPIIPGYTPGTNNPAAQMTGTNGPALVGTEIDPTADTRKVKYWITMSLPTFWTPPPSDAKPEEIYLYRPDFYQDQDGIERRVTLWFNPLTRTRLKDLLGENTPEAKNNTGSGSATPASPALPASQESAQSHNPFRSPFDDSFRSDNTNHPANSSTKSPAPSGLSAPGTNAAPVNQP